MRGVLAVMAVLGLIAAVYLGLRPLLHRPPLRVALELKEGDADDAALAAGVALAIEERDGAAGPWRVSAAHQIRHAGGLVLFPTPPAHTMLYGLKPPEYLPGPAGPLLPLTRSEEEALIREWMRGRDLKRLSFHDPHTFERGFSDPLDPIAVVLKEQPDVILMHPTLGVRVSDVQELRKAGFQGPLFLGWRAAWFWPQAIGQDGDYHVLAPLKSPPSGFRHPHPFAYVGYRGALRYFDALDKDPKVNALGLAASFYGHSLFQEMRERPRIYRVRDGRLTPE